MNSPQLIQPGDEGTDSSAVVRVFVGDLSFFCSEEDLRVLFSAYGQAKTVEIRRGEETQGSLMHGFVEMASLSEASKAASELDGRKFMGRKLRVVIGGNNNRQGGRAQRNGWVQIQVSFVTRRLDVLVNEEVLDDMFRAYGEIMDVTVKKHHIDHERKNQSGYGFVFYATFAEAAKAVHTMKRLNLNGVTFDCNLTHRSEHQLKKKLDSVGSGESPTTAHSSLGLLSPPSTAASPSHLVHTAHPPPTPPPPPAPPLLTHGPVQGLPRPHSAPHLPPHNVVVTSPPTAFAMSPPHSFQPYIPSPSAISYHQGYGHSPPGYQEVPSFIPRPMPMPPGVQDYAQGRYIDATMTMNYLASIPGSPPGIEQYRMYGPSVDYPQQMQFNAQPLAMHGYRPAILPDTGAHMAIPMALSPPRFGGDHYQFGPGPSVYRAPLVHMARSANQRAQGALPQHVAPPAPPSVLDPMPIAGRGRSSRSTSSKSRSSPNPSLSTTSSSSAASASARPDPSNYRNPRHDEGPK